MYDKQTKMLVKLEGFLMQLNIYKGTHRDSKLPLPNTVQEREFQDIWESYGTQSSPMFWVKQKITSAMALAS